MSYTIKESVCRTLAFAFYDIRRSHDMEVRGSLVDGGPVPDLIRRI